MNISAVSHSWFRRLASKNFRRLGYAVCGRGRIKTCRRLAPTMVDCDTSEKARRGWCPGWDPISGSHWNHAKHQYLEMVAGNRYKKARASLKKALGRNPHFEGGPSCVSLPLLSITGGPTKESTTYRCDFCGHGYSCVQKFLSHFKDTVDNKNRNKPCINARGMELQRIADTFQYAASLLDGVAPPATTAERCFQPGCDRPAYFLVKCHNHAPSLVPARHQACLFHLACGFCGAYTGRVTLDEDALCEHGFCRPGATCRLCDSPSDDGWEDV